jgi:CheY-like chemotaxis protein
MVQVLGTTQLDGEQRECLDTIRQCAGSLLGLINDILDISKIEAGKLDLEEIGFPLGDVVESSLEMVAQRAADKQLKLYGVIDSRVPLELRGDPYRLRQVLVNLLGNAVKFTSAGEVALTVSLAEESGGAARLRCEVRDTGIGVPPDAQSRLFQPFVQADSATTRRFGGTGLGLTISRRLVEMMGGAIGLQSRPDVGSTFWFELPLHVAEGIAPAPPPPDLRLLLVGTAENRAVLRRQLERYRFDMHETGTESGAVELLGRAIGEGRPVDAVVMDWPLADAAALRRAIVTNPRDRATRVIVIAGRDQRRAAAELSADGRGSHLTKPVKPSLLVELLRDAPYQAPAAALVPAASPGIRVLVAEDNAVNQRLMSKVLTKLGYEPVVVCDGQQAVEAALQGGFAVILMDCQMPVVDGYEAAAAIRRGEHPGSRVPIVALTANAMKGDREVCLQAGMDDYLVKPVDLGLLGETLRRWIANPTAGAAPDRELEAV